MPPKSSEELTFTIGNGEKREGGGKKSESIKLS